MGMLKDKDKKKVIDIFKTIEHEVKIIFFTQEMECQYCGATREILEEISDISDKITLEIYDFVADAELAKKYGVDKIPATVLIGDSDYGIRFYGVPGGYEFNVLIEDILNIGKRDAGLSNDVVAELNKVDQPVHLQVLISPTWPYCPGAVRTVHRFAMVNDNITADMIDGGEFSFLVNKYNVHGVPHTVINEKDSIIGAQPEMEFARAILKAIGK